MKLKGRITENHSTGSIALAKQVKEGCNEINAFYLSYTNCILDYELLGLEPLGKKLTPRVSSFIIFV